MNTQSKKITLFAPRAELFWPKVTMVTVGCWEWDGLRDRQNYGVVSHNGKRDSTHRVSWELSYGIIPDGMCVLHRCDNPPCVRPTHLFLGTRGDNNRDRSAKGRNSRKSRKTLSTDQVLYVRSMKGIKSGSILAEELDVSQPTISSIWTGRNWSHLI
jgi:hypothetical protein